MLEFHDITLEDRDWMQPLLDASSYRSEEYSFTFSYLWRDIFRYQVARMDDFLLLRSVREKHPVSYLFPPGKGDIRPVLEALLADSEAKGESLTFHAMTAEGKLLLEETMPGKFQFITLTDYFDYVYEAEKLITLSGKKLSNKRNHINRFVENNPDWRFEPIGGENIAEVIAMNEEWKQRHIDDHSSSFAQESDAVDEAIRDFQRLGMDGGLIRAGGEVVAFSIGDRLTNDTYLVHIEKAYSDVQGAYAIINREFAAHYCNDYRYINREDASGQAGLIKAKESYRPVFLVEKFGAKCL